LNNFYEVFCLKVIVLLLESLRMINGESKVFPWSWIKTIIFTRLLFEPSMPQ
jgi:hypothetical protein